MLSIDRRLDKNEQGPHLVLRESMKKFDSDHSNVLEVVKYSQPSKHLLILKYFRPTRAPGFFAGPVHLNRPLIMILDQVSKNQSLTTHQKVTDRIRRLLENELYTMADMLLSEKASVNALERRTPLDIKFRKLKDCGFYLTTEPFFRRLLLAIHYYNLSEAKFRSWLYSKWEIF